MMRRNRGNVWPTVSVAAGALLVLVILPLILQRQNSGRMATVDAQVTIGDGQGGSSGGANQINYRWPDSEVPRTAERLRDVTAVAIAASANVVQGVIERRVPRDANAILANIANQQLIPSEWLTNEPGILQMPNGSVHLRYSPRSLSVELVSVPRDRNDGPAILIRIPDSENPGVRIRYFESMQLDGTSYPPPFAPVAQIIASGWQPKPFRQMQLPDDQRAQLEQWTRTTTLKQR